jgi:hypothetical protein
MTRPVLLLALVACNNSGKAPDRANTDKIRGSLMIAGAPVTLQACRPGYTNHVYVGVQTSRGTLRFEDAALYWTSDREGILRGEQLVCTKLDRSWGGGLRPETGSSYWRGTLAFDCTGQVGVVTGNLDLDCGEITRIEREELDRQRADELDRQRAQKRDPQKP